MENVFPLNIDRLAYGGAGIGRHEGKAIFVEKALPGDTAMVRVLKDHGRYAEAAVVEFLSRAGSLREAACPYVNDCGGCPWMMLEYESQLDWKRSLVEEQFKHISGVVAPVKPTAVVSSEFAYRGRVKLRVAVEGGILKLGYYRPKTHTIVDVERCAIAGDAINILILHLRDYFLQNLSILGRVKELVLESGYPAKNTRMTIVAESALPARFIDGLFDRCISLGGVCVRTGRHVELFGTGVLRQVVKDGIELEYGPEVFSQVNPEGNTELVKAVMLAAGPSPGKECLDLYCGMGNLTFPLAATGANLTGVEQSRQAVSDGWKNREALGADNVEFIAGDSVHVARKLARRGISYDAVLLDPPRSGARGIGEYINKLARERIVYVSCNPVSLARDSREFIGSGFRLASIEPFDLFPQTYHVESVALFLR